ncbi:MAG: PEP-CTERM sorting domain-containing protein [Planctomycetota bacterium]
MTKQGETMNDSVHRLRAQSPNAGGHLVARLSRATATVFGCLCFLAIPNVCCGTLVNGMFQDFDAPTPPGQDPYVGWATDNSIGDAPFDRNDVAVFTVGDGTQAVQLQQEFTLPTNATLLSFEYQVSTTGVRINSGTRDSFQAALYDSTTRAPLQSRDPTFFPAFFSLDNDGSKFLSSFTSNSIVGQVTQVQLDVTGLGGTTVLLDFFLAEDPFATDGLVTSIELDNVMVVAGVPEPGTVGFIAIGSALVLVHRRRRNKSARQHEQATPQA